ncbi:MAG: GerMN domain-containing protein [Treponema sp.]|nr:GerMN domain-containing protein [Treponema sp.]
MAERKTTNRTSRAAPKTPAKKQNAPRKKSLGVLFWFLFIIVIAGLFVVNREIIKRNIQNTGFFDRLFNRETPSKETESETIPEIVDAQPGNIPPTELPQIDIDDPTPEQPSTPVETTAPASPSSENLPAPEKTSPAQIPPAEKPAADMRARSLYFMKLDNDGTIVRTQSSRSLPASDSPMLDVLNALLQGPNANEKRNGLESLIPQGTTILAATVRGSTAYISFSEDFQFNTYGVEGYAAQLRQVVWTVTEFENVKDVQILLEGRRIDYLGEGIWIGSPLSRDTL